MYSLRGDTTCSYIFHVSLSALYLSFLVIFTKATCFHRSKHPWDWLLSDSDSPGDFPCQITRLCENLRLDALVFLFATQIVACVGWESRMPELKLSKINPLIESLYLSFADDSWNLRFIYAILKKTSIFKIFFFFTETIYIACICPDYVSWLQGVVPLTTTFCRGVVPAR